MGFGGVLLRSWGAAIAGMEYHPSPFTPPCGVAILDTWQDATNAAQKKRHDPSTYPQRPPTGAGVRHNAGHHPAVENYQTADLCGAGGV